MPVRYLISHPYALRGWKKLPYALQNYSSGQTDFFRQDDFFLLQCCDGQTVIDREKLTEEETKRISHWLKNGFIRECAPGERLAPYQEYRFYPVRFKKEVQWSITGRCNYRCRHCFMSAPRAAQGEPTWDELMVMLDAFDRCGIRTVHLTGGEPMVRKDFWQLVDAVRARHISITVIYSNGLLVTDEFLDRLTERGLRPHIQFSYDGAGHHDWMRGVPGAEKIVLDAMCRCRERGFSFSASMVLCRESVGCIRESVNLLASLGCSSVKISAASPMGEWLNEPSHSLTQEETWQAFLDYIPKYYADGKPMPIGLEGFFNCDPPKMAPLSYHEKNVPEERFSKSTMCGHVRSGMYVSPQGRVLPCMSMVGSPIEEQYPSLLETPLEEILNESFYMDIINTRISDFMAHNPECASCEFRSACCGGCRAVAVRDGSTDYLKPDSITCAYFKEGWKAKKDALLKSLGVPE